MAARSRTGGVCRYKPHMVAPEPLPRVVPWLWLGTTVAMAALAVGLLAGLGTLRQGRLLDEAIATCAARTGEARTWLGREESVTGLLETERAEARARHAALLDADGAGSLEASLDLLAERHELELQGLRLGTRRAGDTFDTVPATAVFVGDRASLPELLDAFYRQARVVRLVSLDLSLPRFGSRTVEATLRWEFAAVPEGAPEADDPTERWSPPRLVAHASASRLSALNRGRWEQLEDETIALRALAPRLRRLAAMDAERAQLERQRIALERWREASASESLAVQRRMPELYRRMDLSALGEAALRPGPGGLVVAEEP